MSARSESSSDEAERAQVAAVLLEAEQAEEERARVMGLRQRVAARGDWVQLGRESEASSSADAVPSAVADAVPSAVEAVSVFADTVSVFADAVIELASDVQLVPEEDAARDGFADAVIELASAGPSAAAAVLDALRESDRWDMLWVPALFRSIAPAKPCLRDAPVWFPGTQSQYVTAMKIRAGSQTSCKCPALQALCDNWRGAAPEPSASSSLMLMQEASAEQVMEHISEEVRPLVRALLPQPGESHPENVARARATLNTALTLQAMDRRERKEAEAQAKRERQEAKEAKARAKAKARR